MMDFAATLRKKIEALKKLNIEYKGILEYLIIYLSEKKLYYGTEKKHLSKNAVLRNYLNIFYILGKAVYSFRKYL